jgi:hypothetical protein
MNPDRRHPLKTLPVAASVALAWPSAQAKSQTGSATLSLEPAPVTPFRPLEQATLRINCAGSERGTVVLLDGAGHEYLRVKAADKLLFTIGGALGRQVARLLDEHGAIAAELEFAVDCSTRLNDERGLYRGLMEAVLWTMMSWSDNNPVQTIHHNDRVYQFFANWVFDHTLIMKGMKYYWPDLVFHGDNTNLIAQCRNLAEMLMVAGRAQEAPEFEKLADDVERRLNVLAWNGDFYTHWIAENPEYKPDAGVDMSIQVSLQCVRSQSRHLA